MGQRGLYFLGMMFRTSTCKAFCTSSINVASALACSREPEVSQDVRTSVSAQVQLVMMGNGEEHLGTSGIIFKNWSQGSV